MTHFVCSQCGMQSLRAGSCQTESCINNGGALSECHCEDDKHEGIINSSRDEDAPQNRTETTLDLDNETL